MVNYEGTILGTHLLADNVNWFDLTFLFFVAIHCFLSIHNFGFVFRLYYFKCEWEVVITQVSLNRFNLNVKKWNVLFRLSYTFLLVFLLFVLLGNNFFCQSFMLTEIPFVEFSHLSLKKSLLEKRSLKQFKMVLSKKL